MPAFETLLSPVILFFVLGALAAAARSDLSVPEPLAKSLSLYLMAAIGLKGGVQVSQAGFTPQLLQVSAAGMALSFALPLMAFALLRGFARLDRLNAGAVAAHYGSVSIVTFVTASDALTRSGIAPAGYMVAVMALMETPAVITGLLLARGSGTLSRGQRGKLLREVLLNGSVVLLLGSFLIGLAIGKTRFEPIAPVFVTGFTGLLCLFLLDMGLIAMRRLRESRALNWRMAALGIALPLVNGAIGLGVAALLGLDPGTGAALAMLAASASYIAVPAAVRLALPDADPGIYLSMSLAVTFPFNILLGIPLVIQLAPLVLT
ncbi:MULTISPECIES: sodium-dependent bicarbonate transport family permease [unclassified Novosphingobium]|uniref:sodium-dependent bicarbonate transport family permease n=1 Tax=unclassified Novosphingobium TaxID=2644732 RepID=UPI000ED6FDDC|nr:MULTISPECIES: sodium-dependent bicarbonate transport family permease [unclassified Novosphingobium]HCF24504.1 sodium-dependent bicarbonate transport family permease [Novosphingobium sp.]HQV04317.1 sodium-dependent bicarbonate transport family permease [Novosphingobium sp.]